MFDINYLINVITLLLENKIIIHKKDEKNIIYIHHTNANNRIHIINKYSIYI